MAVKTLKDVTEIDEVYTYSDIDIFMNIENNDILLLKDYASVYQAVWNILNTDPGEMPMLATFGLNLKRLIFEPNSNSSQIKNIIIKGIEAWEDRIEIVDLNISKSGVDNNVVTLEFIFQMGNQTILQSYDITK